MASISIAEELAKKQREISVSEFFERNKQILGYDSPTKALVTVVKEGTDNSLDATADADILPDLYVEIKKLDKDEFVAIIEDNGPGIVKREVPNVFGRLLYGSRFHSRRQSLHPEEPVCILRNGRFEITPVERLAERFFEDGEEGALPLPEGILAPCFSKKSGKVRWMPVTHVIRHRTAHPIVRIGLDHGGSVRVTANHSLFSFSPQRGIHPVAAAELKSGDYVLTPREIPEVPEAHRVTRVNL
ncbi:MAG: ATP-binding protein, partial [Candidatus Thermoplasmatota archaeon]